MTRTRTANKTAEATQAPTPAKNATTPALSLVKEHPQDDTSQPSAPVVDLRHPLKPRYGRRNSPTGPYTAAQLTEARACLASATAQLPVPHLLWLTQPNGQAAARLGDGTLLVHTHHRAPEFTAYLRCPTGGLHTEPVTSGEDLHAARATTRTCTRRHDGTDPGAGGYDWHKAITVGIQKAVPSRLSPLTAGMKAVKKTTADTQPLNSDDIATGLAARAADQETPKEHPQP